MSHSDQETNGQMDVAGGRYATSWKSTTVVRTGWKARLRSLARRAMLDLKSAIARPPNGTFVRCLACHYVFDDQIADFQRTMKRLKQLGEFIDTPTLMQLQSGEQPIDGRYFHLSFDDGFKNVIKNALPVLLDNQIPMILFVPSAWVGANWDTARRYSIDIAEYRDVVEMADWSELRQMVSEGFEIGSHTRTHVRLSTLSDQPESLREELAGSKAKIESELGQPCRFIAYPYGKPGDYDDVTFEATRDAGYDAGFGIHRGSIDPHTNPMLLPRHHFEPEWPTKHVAYFASGNMEDFWSKKIKAAGVGGNSKHD